MIPLLPKWHLHANRPTFYDGDAVTMLELASTLHASMNNVIDEYNKLEEEVNKTVTAFIDGEIKNREVFESAIRQEFQDFIDIVNLKIHGFEVDFSKMEDDLINKINLAIRSGTFTVTESYNPDTEALALAVTGGEING